MLDPVVGRGFSKKQVRKDITAERKRVERAEAARLKAEIKAARAGRAPAIRAVRAGAAVERVAVRTHAAERIARVRATVAEIVATNSAKLAHLRELAKLQADADRFVAGKAAKVGRGVRRSESDDAVRGNIDPYLVRYFDHVKGSIKGSPHKSRTETFLQHVEESPDEVAAFLAEWADDIDYEAEYQRRKNPRPSVDMLIEFGAVPNLNTRSGGFLPVIWINGRQSGDTYGRGQEEARALDVAKADALEEASRYVGDWSVVVKPRKLPKTSAASRTVPMFDRDELSGTGQLGMFPKKNPGRAPETKAERRAVKKYDALHWGNRGKEEIEPHKVPDPSGPLVVLGRLRSVKYDTDKRGDGPSTYEHTFSPSSRGKFGQGRPLVCVNEADGLVIVGGGYDVEDRGIVG